MIEWLLLFCEKSSHVLIHINLLEGDDSPKKWIPDFTKWTIKMFLWMESFTGYMEVLFIDIKSELPLRKASVSRVTPSLTISPQMSSAYSFLGMLSIA